MKILQIATADRGGGAERVVHDLHAAYLAHGHDARLVVREKRTDTAFVEQADLYAGTAPWGPALSRLERRVAQQPTFRFQARVRSWLRRSAMPQRWLDTWRGIEDFNYPYAHHLLDGDWKPDIVHAHNLHGD
jgi:glycosyltransferase involved in cell wall biosynthesis